MAAVAPNSVGWYILEGFPWWPVFVCDQTKLRANLHNLGNGHRSILKKARDFPKHYAIVYYFGTHEFSLVPLNKGMVLKPWACEEKAAFVKGHPKHLAKRKATMDELLYAIQEAEDFLSQSEDMRLPPHFVPSDLDPTLEPPPRAASEEEEEEGEDEDEAAAEDEEMEEPEELDEDEAEDEDGEPKAKPKKAKQKKEKKDTPAKKKEKKSKEKKGDSKKSDSKKSDSKKSDSKKSDSKKGESKKRKSEAKAKGERPAKAAKVDAKADAKADERMKEEPAAHEAREDSQTKAEEGPPLEGDELTAKLEKEIRWILLNCQFEEMTTKTVRKLLERRLGMDLRHHKAQIKEGVARVIESMEDANGEADDGAAKPEAGADEPEGDKTEDVKAEDAERQGEDVKEKEEEEVKEDANLEVKEEDKGEAKPKVKPEVKEEAKKDVKEVSEDPKEAVKEEEELKPNEEEELKPNEEEELKPNEEKQLSVAERLRDAASRLEASSATQEETAEVLASLESLASVDRELLTTSKLLPRLVALQSHASATVRDQVKALATKWRVQDALARKKEVDERRLLELKATLERADASNDDICAGLDELAEMPVKIAHLKKTKIARSVADLRQHANDRVSSKANALRKAWMKLASRDNTEALKMLDKMNRVLEQREEGEAVHAAQLEALDKLLGTSLRTQDIIESKIGVVVSKLRKSSDAKVAKAAAKLRKKWKSEAGAA